MPGSAREVANAEEEGVEFVWLSSPKEFKGTNKVEKIIVDQIKLGDPDETGRRKPQVQEGSSYETKADMVIKALGFDPEDLPNLFDSSELQVTKWGTIKTDFDTMETNIKGVFAAGDSRKGPVQQAVRQRLPRHAAQRAAHRQRARGRAAAPPETDHRHQGSGAPDLRADEKRRLAGRLAGGRAGGRRARGG